MRQRGQLHQRPDHPAMQGRQERIADQMLGERQHQGKFVALQFRAHAQEIRVGNARQRGGEAGVCIAQFFFSRKFAPILRVAAELTMKAEIAWAIGFSGASSNATARTKATLRPIL